MPAKIPGRQALAHGHALAVLGRAFNNKNVIGMAGVGLDKTLYSLRQEITKALKDAGFAYITMDLQGYRTGAMNEVIPESLRGQQN